MVRKIEGQVGFVVQARRGVVVRCFARTWRDRCLVEAVEVAIVSAETFLDVAYLINMLRRRARSQTDLAQA